MREHRILGSDLHGIMTLGAAITLAALGLITRGAGAVETEVPPPACASAEVADSRPGAPDGRAGEDVAGDRTEVRDSGCAPSSLAGGPLVGGPLAGRPRAASTSPRRIR